MIRTLDKYILKLFVLNYVVSLAVLLSLYVVLDLFFNFDEFIHEEQFSVGRLVTAIATYYGSHLFLYFSQISGVITLFAMAFTLMRLQLGNEFVAIVASGVSLHRIALTVIMIGLATNLLWVANQELIIPRLAPHLAQTHDSVALDRPYGVWFVRDDNGALLSATGFDQDDEMLWEVLLVDVPGPQGQPQTITADRARWIWRPEKGEGRWELSRGVRLVAQVDDLGAVQMVREPVDAVRSSLSPDEIALRQSATWYQFLSRAQLSALRRQDPRLSRQTIRTLNNRFATPMVNILVLIIGIPIFLDRQPASAVQSGGRCLVICGACFLFAFFSQNATIDRYPSLPAWLPLIVLTPIMVIMLDRMRT